MIYRVYFQIGDPGVADELSVDDLWDENLDFPHFFQDVLTELVDSRFYNDSDPPDTFCLYTTDDPDQLLQDICAWFDATPEAHCDDMASWVARLKTRVA